MMSVDETDGDEPAAEVKLGDLEALQGVVKFPVRIKCATLAWNTLIEAMADRVTHLSGHAVAGDPRPGHADRGARRGSSNATAR